MVPEPGECVNFRSSGPLGAEPPQMSDIFLSYAREDRSHARRLGQALEAQGWSVWWDPEIPPGRAFDDVIEEALDAARCVVVLWSRASVKSRWVKTEANEGAERDVLVPALLEEVRPPLAFRRLQAADLRAWNGTDSTFGFRSLVNAIENLLGPSPAEAKHQAEEEARRRQADTEAKRQAEEDAARRQRIEDAKRQAAAEALRSSMEQQVKWLKMSPLKPLALGAGLAVVLTLLFVAGSWMRQLTGEEQAGPSLSSELEQELLQARRVEDQGSPEDAIRLLSGLLDGTHANNPFILINLGNVYWRQSELDRAVTFWERVMAENPNFAPAFLNLAYYHKQMFEFPTSSEYTAKAEELDPVLAERYSFPERLVEFPLRDPVNP